MTPLLLISSFFTILYNNKSNKMYLSFFPLYKYKNSALNYRCILQNKKINLSKEYLQDNP